MTDVKELLQLVDEHKVMRFIVEYYGPGQWSAAPNPFVKAVDGWFASGEDPVEAMAESIRVTYEEDDDDQT